MQVYFRCIWLLLLTLLTLPVNMPVNTGYVGGSHGGYIGAHIAGQVSFRPSGHRQLSTATCHAHNGDSASSD